MKDFFSTFPFLRGRASWLVHAILLIQAIGFHQFFSGREVAPNIAPLSRFPASLGDWRMVEDERMDAESLKILEPDDYIIRAYRDPGGNGANLFVAYFRSQNNEHAPHSPQNCLPGSGWAIQSRAVLPIATGEPGETISVNRFVIGKGQDRALALYWYHGPSTIVANEYRARFQLVMDSMRYHRSDTSLVRIVIPVSNQDDAAAERRAVDFARFLNTALRRQIPLATDLKEISSR